MPNGTLTSYLGRKDTTLTMMDRLLIVSIVFDSIAKTLLFLTSSNKLPRDSSIVSNRSTIEALTLLTYAHALDSPQQECNP